MNRFYLGALCLTLTCLGSMASAAPPQYTVIDLGNQEAGQGLVWQQLVETDVSYYPGLGSQNFAYASNSAAVVGDAVTADKGAAHAARWVPYVGGATFTDLGLLPNASQFGRDPSSHAYGLNLIGDIVGQSDSQYVESDGGYHAAHAFVWNSGVMTDLGAIAGNGYESAAHSINDSREIVGWTSTISSVDGTVLTRAFVYTAGTMYNLTFYEIGGPKYLLDDAWAIDCQGNIAAVGIPAGSSPPYPRHNYLLVRQGPARTNCVK